MDMRGYQHYKQDSLSTMTPGELLLLLYDELVKRLTQAQIALDKENYTLLEESCERSLAILHYLDATLDRKYPISRNLHQMYEFFSYELRRVNIGRNRTELERVKKMVMELRDSFRQADKKAGQQEG